MDVFQLTRALVDIESITGNEKAVGEYLAGTLSALAAAHNGRVEILPVEPDRNNVFVHFGEPTVTLSTHMDTVPPFFASSEDADFIHGRASCDTKGIIAAMIKAAEALLAQGTRNFGLLFVVGEERNSAGAFAAAKTPRGSKFLINGEPTENKLALGSKGAMRIEIETFGRMAHSAYPELGESAILKLLDILQDVRRVPLPTHPILGPSTLNIALISGGRAPNVIPDHARVEILVRLVDDGSSTREAVETIVGERGQLNEVLCIPALHMGALEGFETTVVSYTTDIPAFNGAWGKPHLLGPGTIHVAHTDQERVPKSQLLEAVQIYQNMVRQLLA
jgi:acetylornithine deacetylase